MNRPYPRRRKRRYERPQLAASSPPSSVMHHVGYAMQEEANRQARKWPVSAALLERRINTLAPPDDLRHAKQFRVLVDSRRRVVEHAAVVAIVSNERNTDELLARLPPQAVVLGATDGASLPRAIPAQRIVSCAACGMVAKLLPNESLVTCPCTCIAFCSELCRRHMKSGHDCKPALQVAHSVVSKLSRTAGWPLMSVIEPQSGRILGTISAGSCLGFGHVLTTSLGAALESDTERGFVAASMALVAKTVACFVDEQETCSACRALTKRPQLNDGR